MYKLILFLSLGLAQTAFATCDAEKLLAGPSGITTGEMRQNLRRIGLFFASELLYSLKELEQIYPEAVLASPVPLVFPTGELITARKVQDGAEVAMKVAEIRSILIANLDQPRFVERLRYLVHTPRPQVFDSYVIESSTDELQDIAEVLSEVSDRQLNLDGSRGTYVAYIHDVLYGSKKLESLYAAFLLNAEIEGLHAQNLLSPTAEEANFSKFRGLVSEAREAHFDFRIPVAERGGALISVLDLYLDPRRQIRARGEKLREILRSVDLNAPYKGQRILERVLRTADRESMGGRRLDRNFWSLFIRDEKTIVQAILNDPRFDPYVLNEGGGLYYKDVLAALKNSDEFSTLTAPVEALFATKH